MLFHMTVRLTYAVDLLLALRSDHIIRSTVNCNCQVFPPLYLVFVFGVCVHVLDINECLIGTHNCHVDASCENINGFFNCHCLVGYSGIGTQCDG